MAVWNLGSINIDHVYRVPHHVTPGETLAATAYAAGLGGKGANQSVAAARAGASVFHIGAVGRDGGAVLAEMAAYGVDMTHTRQGDVPTGHAVITVDPAGENAIVIFSGANLTPDETMVAQAFSAAQHGDTVLLQNETTAQVAAARLGAARGMRVVYSAAPFDVAAVRAVLPHVSLLVMNELEAAQLHAALGEMPGVDRIVTQGSKGATWFSAGSEPLFTPAFKVTPVDTTGAGDTFIGTLAAALDAGMERPAAMRRAAAASAIQVTRPGAASAIPSAAEVDAFLAAR